MQPQELGLMKDGKCSSILEDMFYGKFYKPIDSDSSNVIDTPGEYEESQAHTSSKFHSIDQSQHETELIEKATPVLKSKPKILKIENVDISLKSKYPKANCLQPSSVNDCLVGTKLNNDDMNDDKNYDEFGSSDSDDYNSDFDKDSLWSCEASEQEESEDEPIEEKYDEELDAEDERDELRHENIDQTLQLSSFGVHEESILSSTRINDKDPEYRMSESERKIFLESQQSKENSQRADNMIAQLPKTDNVDSNFFGMQATDFNNLKVPCTSNEPIEKEKMCELCGKYCEHLKLHITRHHANQPGADAIIRRIDSNYKLVKNLQVPISKEGKQKRQLKFHMCKFCETD
ncbi:hypothetical protein TKK_0000323 [Trichogramma kaykai]